MAEPRKRPHAADGIEEYDNPLPRWWVWLFYGTILFSLGYWVAFPTLPGQPGLLDWSQIEAYARELAAAPRPAAAGVADMANAIRDRAAVEAGMAVFARNCASCHAPAGSGKIGPSLRDSQWVKGTGAPEEILGIVAEGTAKGMPGWKHQLSGEELVQVAAFVHGLSHPGDPHHPARP